MNLLAWSEKQTRYGANRFAAAFGLAAILSAQMPLCASAAEGAVLAGANVTFIASADGSPAPTFQWRKNGNAIAGATNAILSFNAVSSADAGIYQVVATNEAGSAVSPDETLVVETTPTGTGSDILPAILTQPVASQTGLPGGSVSFSVSASGVPTPTFQWKKNGVAMAGATDATLQLVALTANDNGSYVAYATNTVGTVASNSAVLVVSDPTTNPPTVANVAPAIVTQPSATQTAIAGGSVNFTVTASGVPTPSFQWKKNGTTIVGATEASLTLSSVTTTDSATYVAVASNTAGSATSNAAVLTVTGVTTPPPPPPTSLTTATPVITNQPASTQTVVAGSSVSFTVGASGSPAPSFQWRKNGSKIAGATAATLTLSSVASRDAAAYSVVVSNSAGAVASENSTLYVHSIPTFSVQPAPQAVILGTSTKFNVVVSAIPGATLQWHKNGNPIAGATSSVLVVNSTSTADVGAYSVVAKNELGVATSNEALLAIAIPPIITTQPISQSVSAKGNIILKTAASGFPAPTYQWKKNGTNITGATQATLELKGVNKPDAGEYSAEARNVAGWVLTKKATVIVDSQTGRQPHDEGGIEPVGGETDTLSGLVNLSVRANAGTGADGLIVGFVIDGSSSKSVLVRGVGPTLRDFGVAGALSDPQLSLYSGAVMTASNDDWSANDNAAQIVGTSVRVGAFSLADRTSDAALMATLENGAYTVQLSGKGTARGVALVEVYDAATSGLNKLVNLSVRAYIGSDSDVPNLGFVVAGTTARKVMIRAVGPTLGAFGVSDSIADPQLELFRGATRIDQNDNWGGSAALSTTFAEVGAFGFADATSRDAVLLTTLEPGAYTVVVTGVNGTKGTGLVEVYDVP
jgi:hypothetical protein